MKNILGLLVLPAAIVIIIIGFIILQVKVMIDEYNAYFGSDED